MATQIIYNGTVIGTVDAGQSKILKCNGKKMKSDVEIRAGARTEIKYDGAVIATVEAGKSKTIKCAGETLKSNIEIRVEDDTPGKDGVSPTVEMIDIEGGTRIIITDVNGPKSTDIMDGKDGAKGEKGDTGATGSNGSNGVGIKSVVQTTTSSADGGSNVITVTKTDNTTSTFTVKNGSKGSKGDKGDTGAQGIQGIQGEKGADGAKGDKGDKGDKGADGERGTGILKVTTAPTSYTTATNGVTPIKRMSISTIKSQAGVSEVLVGDLIAYSYYQYHVYYLDGTYAYMDSYQSVRGATGAAGKDGTSVTVSEVTESTSDGGSNVVTFSDGKTLTVKNGSKGSAGEDGSDGRDGADGKTPVKGVDYYTEADKAEIVAAVIESLGGNPIFGIVDENNNIIVNGDLPDGTYTVKYEMEGGKIINIGNLVLDSNVYYTVTKNLTNCTISNSATQIVQGGSYSATISANDGFELKSVSVTMGGSAVSVSGGVINIASVTGDIVITAVAEEKAVEVEPTNFFKATPTVNTIATASQDAVVIGGRLGSDNGYRVDGGPDCMLTNYIPVANGDEVYVTNLSFSTTLNSGMYKSDKTIIGGFKPDNTSYVTNVATSGNVQSFKISNANAGYVRISGKPGVVKNASGATVDARYDLTQIVINVKRNGTWL